LTIRTLPAKRVAISWVFRAIAQYSELPVYKATYDLLLAILQLSKSFNKECKHTVGETLKQETIKLITLIYRADSRANKGKTLQTARQLRKEKSKEAEARVLWASTSMQRATEKTEENPALVVTQRHGACARPYGRARPMEVRTHCIRLLHWQMDVSAAALTAQSSDTSFVCVPSGPPRREAF
jgi:hypothetical protein